MRVFILCTGRSGSTTIIKAAQHIENYTAGHESLSNKLGADRYRYPDNHIEADNRLSWHLGQLDKIFGNDALYVHLKRDRDKVARSFYKRFLYPGSMIDAFSEGIRKNQTANLTNEEMLQTCYDYIDTVNTNIELFISDKKHTMAIDIENIEHDFTELWRKISAQGNLDAALEEFKTTHNASVKRKLDLVYRIKLIVLREWKHLRMYLQSR